MSPVNTNNLSSINKLTKIVCFSFLIKKKQKCKNKRFLPTSNTTSFRSIAGFCPHTRSYKFIFAQNEIINCAADVHEKCEPQVPWRCRVRLLRVKRKLVVGFRGLLFSVSFSFGETKERKILSRRCIAS